MSFQVELLSGGVNMPVTHLNVYEYVRKYAEHRMLVVAEQPLHVSAQHCLKPGLLLGPANKHWCIAPVGQNPF